MSALKPFAAVFYNKEVIPNLSNVFCPPYDIISAQQQEDYYKQDPYNFIRLELAKETSKDSEKDNKYTRARKTYDEWLKKGILKKDGAPCIYFYKQDYKYQGRRYTRMGFLGLLKLNEDSGVRILPHEHTHAAAKTDRFTLWSALKSDLSPIFVGYSDRGGRIDRVFLKELAMTKPYLEATDHDKVKHTIWRLEDPDKIQ
ncbi:MAG: DUF1015 family protein, partial [Candidatus Omnitrophica bacterium]|nr:DUF1015 family protein [Candidatus Omnitrophota bacterium]